MSINHLSKEEVHVWIVDLNQAPLHLELGLKQLSQDELVRADRLIIPQGRARFIAARSQLREILSSYVSILPNELTFTYGLHGKPELAGNDEKAPRFNLSHSGDIALVAVNLHHPIGIDIERQRGDRPFMKLAERFFSHREKLELSKLPESLQAKGFYTCWARKEAFLKACGTGLATPLHSFDVTLNPDQPSALIENRLDTEEKEHFCLFDIVVQTGYFAALATSWKNPRISVRNWPESTIPQNS